MEGDAPRWESVRELLLPPDYANGRRQAALLLGARDSSASNAVSALVLAIGRENIPVVAYEEFTALGRIGPAASEAVPVLLAWLTRPDPVPVQLTGMKIWEQGAAWALVRIAPEDP